MRWLCATNGFTDWWCLVKLSILGIFRVSFLIPSLLHFFFFIDVIPLSWSQSVPSSNGQNYALVIMTSNFVIFSSTSGFPLFNKLRSNSVLICRELSICQLSMNALSGIKMVYRLMSYVQKMLSCYTGLSFLPEFCNFIFLGRGSFGRQIRLLQSSVTKERFFSVLMCLTCLTSRSLVLQLRYVCREWLFICSFNSLWIADKPWFLQVQSLPADHRPIWTGHQLFA